MGYSTDEYLIRARVVVTDKLKDELEIWEKMLYLIVMSAGRIFVEGYQPLRS